MAIASPFQPTAKAAELVSVAGTIGTDEDARMSWHGNDRNWNGEWTGGGASTNWAPRLATTTECADVVLGPNAGPFEPAVAWNWDDGGVYRGGFGSLETFEMCETGNLVSATGTGADVTSTILSDPGVYVDSTVFDDDAQMVGNLRNLRYTRAGSRLVLQADVEYEIVGGVRTNGATLRSGTVSLTLHLEQVGDPKHFSPLLVGTVTSDA